jgi:hypothetical protein
MDFDWVFTCFGSPLFSFFSWVVFPIRHSGDAIPPRVSLSEDDNADSNWQHGLHRRAQLAWGCSFLAAEEDKMGYMALWMTFVCNIIYILLYI